LNLESAGLQSRATRRIDWLILGGLHALHLSSSTLAFYKGYGFFRDEALLRSLRQSSRLGLMSDQPPGPSAEAHPLGSRAASRRDSLFAIRFVPCHFRRAASVCSPELTRPAH